ncbi:MAG: hypothetical protein ACAH83_13480 [Alphaproteobacteria bacterium]
MKGKFDGAIKKPDAEEVAEALFESGARTDTAMTFSPALAFLFNGNAAAKEEGLQAINLIITGVEPDLAIAHAYENLHNAAVRKMMN